MSLQIGQQLGSYEITSFIGKGGMGEVYRARDTRLKRDVAIKILPDEFSRDTDRVARFQREAESLAALNHPNIAGIYDLQQSDATRFLILELVDGDTLADILKKRGALPVDDALQIAKQICEGLEAAHERGIIHRDLKPANVKITPDGKVKVLDFGLAKAFAAEISTAALSNSPTLSVAATNAGVILGTAAYMSPEQAKGRPVDRRTDIFAFGCVLYEMLTGHAAFCGESTSDILAAVIRAEPEWAQLPQGTPPPVRRLLRRCLQKDPNRRLQFVADARIEITEVGAETETEVVAVTPTMTKRGKFAWIVAAILLIGLLTTAATIALRRGDEVSSRDGLVQFTIGPPEKTTFGGAAGAGTGIATQVSVSPDGRNIVFVAGAPSAYKIWLRPVATLAAAPIPGTEGGAFPFWSPDSRSIGFFAAGKLWRVLIAGGVPISLCDAPGGRGGTWSRDNVILFSSTVGDSPGGLLRVTSAGGVPTIVTTLDPATGETNHRWPYFLPDGRHFIYTASTGACCPASKPSLIRIGSLDKAGAPITLFQAESSVSYASGYLLFAQDNTLMAQPFDVDALELKGDPFPLAEYVGPEGSRYVAASVSDNGTLVYSRGGSLGLRELTRFNRQGRPLGTLGDAGLYAGLALSPDERSLAVAQRTGTPNNREIWLIDIARDISSRLTFDPGNDGAPVWSPDGSRIAFGAQGSGKVYLRQKLANETAADETLFEYSGTPARPCGGGECVILPNGYSADARYIAYTLSGSFPLTSDIWILPLFGERKSFPLAQTEFLEYTGVFSPDMRYIAYSSDEAGMPNIYVQPFLRAGVKYPVSRYGGSHPVWRADSKELFYLGLDGTLMAVPVDTTGQFDVGVPQSLFPTGTPIVGNLAFAGSSLFAVTKDGQEFLVNVSTQQAGAVPLTVVINWTALIPN